MTLDEWAKAHAPHLKQNLEANLRVYAPEMDAEEFASLIRMNLIMVRDWAKHSTLVPANDSTLALKNADSTGLRERVEAVVYGIPLERDEQLIDRLVAFVQSERQQAAEQMREAVGHALQALADDAWKTGTIVSEARAMAIETGKRKVLALPLTGGA